MIETIVILGAAALQIPLIRYVKDRGYRTVVVSIPGDYPGFQLADRCVYCDVRDGDAILEQIKDEHVVAVMTDQTDLSVPTVAYISNRLGLPANKVETAIAYSNKHAMREACTKVNVHNPNYIRAHSLADLTDWNIFPAIIKPEDNQGSRGVWKINSREELERYFSDSIAYSRTGYVMVEEFFVGDEVVVEGFVKDGEYLNWGIGERRYFSIPDLLIPSQTLFPALLNDEIHNKLIESERKLHAYLHPSFGMIHSEYIVNRETGEICLVETALRGGGVYISSHLIPLYCGYENYKLLADCALGKDVCIKEEEASFHHKASAYICFYLPDGIIESIKGVDELCRMNGVILADIENLKVGQRTKPMLNKTQRLGPIIVNAKDRKRLEELIKRVQNTLIINVKGIDGVTRGIQWN